MFIYIYSARSSNGWSKSSDISICPLAQPKTALGRSDLRGFISAIGLPAWVMTEGTPIKTSWSILRHSFPATSMDKVFISTLFLTFQIEVIYYLLDSLCQFIFMRGLEEKGS